MRVLMALDYYRPNVSGLSLYVERLAGGLAARGHQVTILTHRHVAGLPLEETGPIHVSRAPVLARFGKALVSPALLARASTAIRGSDLLHLHAPLAPAAPLAMLAQARGVPIIVTYHCDLKPPAGVWNRGIEAIARASQNFALDRAARVITYTEDYARHTEALAERPERVGWILPPVPDPPRSAADPARIRERFGVRGSPVILFLGRFAEEKGLPHLLTAFATLRARFPEAALVLAGENEAVPGEAVGARLKPLLADPASGIVATGLVPPESVPELFRIADVLVLPSINSTESFGLVQVEGMLCGVPSVASDLPGVRQPVRMTGMGEIAAIGDPDDLAGKLVRVLEAPERYRVPRERIRETFSLERTLDEYERVYRQAVS
jgi:glycosyltransferase involved in cell wall biosynthesis